MSRSQLLLPLLVFLFLACAPSSIYRSADSPRATRPGEEVALPLSAGVNKALRIPVGRPDEHASLAVWVNEPKVGTPIRGTVLFLHGFMANHRQLAGAAAALRGAGYRTVLLDLRGFGQSSAGTYTFGFTDAKDLGQVTDALEKMNLCGRTIGVYGTSYGAAAAILFAAADPRVSTVIAVAPFAEIREEVPAYSRHILGETGQLFSNAGLNSLANAVSDIIHMDLDDAKPIEAIARTRAPILLIHGDMDTIIPHSASEKLAAAGGSHCRLVTIHGRGHLDLCFDPYGELQKTTRDWFNTHLSPAGLARAAP